MKRLVTEFALSTALSGVGAQAASADAPTIVEFDEHFPDVNPCTGSRDVFQIHNLSRDHGGHANVFLSIGERTRYAASGFEIVNGRAVFVDNNNGIKLSISDQWVQPETGQRLHATYILKLDVRTASSSHVRKLTVTARVGRNTWPAFLRRARLSARTPLPYQGGVAGTHSVA